MKLTYISLFSGAGVGCFGFKQQGFNCIATNELISRRLKIQHYNKKCLYDSGYVEGSILDRTIKSKIFQQINFWEKQRNTKGVDLVIATPPCQGMSVANHKKKNEKGRNSLVIESIKVIKEVIPRFFILENVRNFLRTICTDVDGIDRPIGESIELNLGGQYQILSKVINLKDYGSNSSRTRTLVLGVRKDIKNITPHDIFPKKTSPKTLRQLISHLPHLKIMGEISKDIFHSYRKFDPVMFSWIENLGEGQSAFQNTDESRIPHRIIDNKIVFNKNKNGDKYARWYWDREGPCIHTRNDTLSSQNTVHPNDNRVFSIRELMLMMTIPKTFKWSETPEKVLNNLSKHEKEDFLKKEELTIRQCIGEAIPTSVMENIASNICGIL